MTSGEREGGGGSKVPPSSSLTGVGAGACPLFSIISPPLLLPKELNCLGHQALVRAGQLGRKIYHPNHQPAKTSRQDTEGAGRAGRGAPEEGVSGLSRADSLYSLPCPHSRPVEARSSGALLCLLGTLIMLGFPKQIRSFDLVAGAVLSSKGWGRIS